jgi:hypothetical protein
MKEKGRFSEIRMMNGGKDGLQRDLFIGIKALPSEPSLSESGEFLRDTKHKPVGVELLRSQINSTHKEHIPDSGKRLFSRSGYSSNQNKNPSLKRSQPLTTSESTSTRARLITFYLPQFYPIPENNQWWGKGFTEWTNVVRATSLFAGHYQPRLPANLGFYDLRVPEVRRAQADLAQAHSIEGFCYWHYWFHGKFLLERPFNEVLSSGEPDFPFCLSWANETWSRRWHGTGHGSEVLQEQTYSLKDDIEHSRWLALAFSDRRYIRVQGRPLFLIYRPFDLPDPKRTTDTIRGECVKMGIPEPYLLGINAHQPQRDTMTAGFDATLNFEPQLSAVPGPTEPGLKIYDYVNARKRMRSQKRDYLAYPCIFVSWDNTPRRGEDGIVFINATPDDFGRGLAEIIQSVADRPHEQRLVFINAWNEWAEGNHLEPDLRYGLQWLEAVKRENLLDTELELPRGTFPSLSEKTVVVGPT